MTVNGYICSLFGSWVAIISVNVYWRAHRHTYLHPFRRMRRATGNNVFGGISLFCWKIAWILFSHLDVTVIYFLKLYFPDDIWLRFLATRSIYKRNALTIWHKDRFGFSSQRDNSSLHSDHRRGASMTARIWPLLLLLTFELKRIMVPHPLPMQMFQFKLKYL